MYSNYILLFCLLISCNEVFTNSDPIIGEWYQIGSRYSDRSKIRFIEPFKESPTLRIYFSKDSFYSNLWEGQVLSRKLDLLENGREEKIDFSEYHPQLSSEGNGLKWSKENDIYKTQYVQNYFSIVGDTLKWNRKNDETTDYYFKKNKE